MEMTNRTMSTTLAARDGRYSYTDHCTGHVAKVQFASGPKETKYPCGDEGDGTVISNVVCRWEIAARFEGLGYGLSCDAKLLTPRRWCTLQR